MNKVLAWCRETPGHLVFAFVVVGVGLVSLLVLVIGIGVAVSVLSGTGAPTAAASTMTGSSDAREARLRQAIVSVDYPCVEVTRVYFQGVDRSDRADTWNAACTGGHAYSIRIKPDGSNKILSCSVLEAVAGVRCFEPLR